MQLTEKQRLAVETTAPYVGVVAGAGVGKTRVLIERIKFLVDSGVSPSAIIAFTFTNRAAKELKDRLADGGVEGVLAGTFHALAYHFNPHKPNVLQQSDAESLLIECAKSIGDKSGIKSLLKKVDTGSDPALCDLYESRLVLENKADFRSLLNVFAKQLGVNPPQTFEHVLVDEAQDTDLKQWAIVDLIVARGAKLFAVGDCKQQLYEWRGADSKYFMSRVSVEYELNETFRLPPPVCQLHNDLAEAAGINQPLIAIKEEGHMQLTDQAPAAIVAALVEDGFDCQDIAILCRTNRMVDSVKQDCEAASIPVAEQYVPGLAKSGWVALLSYLSNPTGTITDQLREFARETFPRSMVGSPLHVLYGDSQTVASAVLRAWMESTFISPTVGTVLTELEILSEIREDARRCELKALNNIVGDYSLREGMSVLNICASEFYGVTDGGVTICTVHQAKGLEWPAVVAVSEMRSSWAPPAEEYRVALVQATRCSELLVISDRCNEPGILASIARKQLRIHA